MRHFLSLSLLMLVLAVSAACGLAADCAVPADAWPLNVKNSTGSDIKAIYLAKTGTEEWSKNLLDEATPFKKGAVAALSLERKGSFSLWAMKVVDTRGRETLHEKLPLSFVYDIELKPDGKAVYQPITRDT